MLQNQYMETLRLEYSTEYGMTQRFILPLFAQDVLTQACRYILDVSDAAALYIMHEKQYFLIL
jgi:hypothetical protein